MNLPPPSKAFSALPERIRHHALECVMCGICVPHCPTFALTQNEADGPRGRISLALGLSSGQLTADAPIVDHLDHCLSCLACESVCPSQVQYGTLMDDVRDALATGVFAASADQPALPAAAQRHWTFLRNNLFSQRQTFGHLWSILSFLAYLRIGGFIRARGGRFGRTLPPELPDRFHPSQAKTRQPATDRHAAGKKVGLFIGCTGESLNSDAVRASIRALQALGYAVETPKAQVCCGAMHQHGGDSARAVQLRAENDRVFSDPELAAIVVIGSACTAELLREPHSIPVMEITEFLAGIPDADWPALHPNTARVAIHLPCSQTRALKQPGSTERLLRKIPGLTILSLATNDRCCGAAGMHVLMYPEQADALRRPKLTEIDTLEPDFVVSANIGCATHLAAGLGVPVRHPVELTARALD